jgi:hypothetical protein
MSIINRVIAKLYYNFKYGIDSPRQAQYIVAKIAFCLLACLWLVTIVKVSETYLFESFRLTANDSSIILVYIILFLIGSYFLNKWTWTISEVEVYINDDANYETLKATSWLIVAIILIPMIVLLLLPKA